MVRNREFDTEVFHRSLMICFWMEFFPPQVPSRHCQCKWCRYAYRFSFLMTNCCLYFSYENIGYKTSSAYKSSYRTRQYPTLTPQEAVVLNGRLSHCHRTHSEHSLQSITSGTLEPLPDFKTAGGNALDHEVGAYNVPHQRTSWNYDSVEQGLNRMGSNDSLPPQSPRKLCSGFPPPVPHHRASPVQQRGISRTLLMRKASEGNAGVQIKTGLPPNPSHYGSLDRRFLKNRRTQNQARFHDVVTGADSTARLPPPPPSPLSPGRQFQQRRGNESQQLVRRLSQSTQQFSPRKQSAPSIGPSDGGNTPPPPDPTSGVSVKTCGNSVELTKPYDSNDVLKYSTRVHINLQSPTHTNSSNSLNSLGSPTSPLRTISPQMRNSNPASRPPPPPYRSPRMQNHIAR